ncbi:MAG: tetratricopeptide repeat protein [Aquificaceae bacterium]|nr:tetratricopeptide repeat protein [Aquificaceae bacterium]MDW8097214.1 tetratricopeptide repeat protein [Aquificaceae bacterium]
MMEKGYRGVFSKMGEGLLEKFVQDLLQELEQRPEDPELLFKLGVAYTRTGKTSQAREIYKRLKQVDPQRAKELLDLIYDY